MFSTGTVVCLQTTPEIIFERLRAQMRKEGEDSQRPMLGSAKQFRKIEELIEIRSNVYAECDMVIDTGNKTQQMVALEIVKGLGL